MDYIQCLQKFAQQMEDNENVVTVMRCILCDSVGYFYTKRPLSMEHIIFNLGPEDTQELRIE